MTLALSYEVKIGDGATRSWSFAKPYIHVSHVKVTVAGTVVAASTTGSTVTLGDGETTPVAAAEIIVYRDTPTVPLVAFTSTTLNDTESSRLANLQAIYLAEERKDRENVQLRVSLAEGTLGLVQNRSTRASRVLGFDADGQPTLFSPTAPISTTDILCLGTGDPAVDTPALQAAVDLAAATKKPIRLAGTFKLKISSTPRFFFANRQAYAAYVAVLITGDNVRFIGPATIKMAPIDFTYTPVSDGPRFIWFSTLDNIGARSQKNISFENITFDYEIDPALPGLPPWLQTIYCAGTEEISVQNCRFTVTPQEADVTITVDGSNNALITWPNTHHPFVNGKGVVWFDGVDLPPEIQAGAEFYGRGSANPFKISTIDTGTTLIITPGTYHCSAKAVQFNGRGLYMANCHNYRGAGNTFEFLRQGYYAHFVYGWQENNVRFHQVSEGFDWDVEVEDINVSGVFATNFWSDGQIFDASPIRNAVIENVTAKGTRNPIAFYTKPFANGDYPFFHKHHLTYLTVNFVAGSPGTVAVAEADLREGDRVYFDHVKLATPTLPTGAAFWTTYYVRNPTGVGLPFNISATPSGSLINLTGSVVGVIFMRVIADPTTIKASEKIVLRGVTITDVITEASDADFYDDVAKAEAVLRPGIFIGHQRSLVAGTDRAQYLRDVPRICQDIHLSDFDITGGKGAIWCGECDHLSLSNFKIRNIAPGTDDTDGASIFLSQSVHDTDAQTQGILRASVRDVEIISSSGMGMSVQLPTKLDIDGLTIAGYNSQAADETRLGLRITHLQPKTSLISLRRIDVSGGVNGATLPCRDFHLQRVSGSAASRAHLLGPFRASSTAVGKIHFYADIGALVANKQMFSIPTVDTTNATGAASVKVPLYSNGLSDAQILYGSVTNLDAIAGSASNYTSAVIRKSTSGSVLSVSGITPIDNGTIAACTEAGMSVGGTDFPNDTVVAATDVLYVEFLRNGTGSVLPRVIVELVIVPYTT